MSRYTGPKNRLSRREGMDLFGKGLKLRRGTVPPGQHGARGTRRLSDYGTRLREKQKTRRIYGIIERQFAGYFDKARKIKGNTGENLLRLLETRLDNVVYRLGLAASRAMARQMVSHGHVMVNNRRIQSPSYQVTVGMVISLDSRLSASAAVLSRLEHLESKPPAWLKRTGVAGQVITLPERTDIDNQINEQLIVEYYSR